MTDRRIRFNGFKCSTVAHTTAGLWRHPSSQSHRYRELSFWIELAKTLERGKFDGLFIADALGVLDVYRGSPDQTLREGLQIPTDDPLLAVSAMAAVTRHLGFGITVSSLYELPYLFARKMTTLDHLTDGRIGLNIVTSALDSAARNLGREQQVPRDERYAVTDEFMEVVYKLSACHRTPRPLLFCTWDFSLRALPPKNTCSLSSRYVCGGSRVCGPSRRGRVHFGTTHRHRASAGRWCAQRGCRGGPRSTQHKILRNYDGCDRAH